jgi:hypothetical protein
MSPTTSSNSAEWWRTILDRFSALILQPSHVEEFRSRIPADLLERDTLLSDGAMMDDLAALEARLGRPVPASYRALLQASNGLAMFGPRLGRLLAAGEADWYPKRHPEEARHIETLLKQEGTNRRPFADPKWTIDIPLHALEISESFNGASLLLHPRRGRGGGEWDVWFSRPSSATRYATLSDFVEQELRSLSKRA